MPIAFGRFFIFVLLSLGFIFSQARAQSAAQTMSHFASDYLDLVDKPSVSLPIHTTKTLAASDLVDHEGKLISLESAMAMAKAGKDLSLFNPEGDNFWQKKSYSASDEEKRFFPTATAGVTYLETVGFKTLSYLSNHISLVYSNERPELPFELTITRTPHSVLMRAALMRRLGFFVPSPKYYKNLKIRFSSEEAKKTYLDEVSRDFRFRFQDCGWIVAEDATSVTFASAILQPAEDYYNDFPRGIAPDVARDPTGDLRELVRIQGVNRTWRSLLLPLVLVNIPESLNRFSPKVARVTMDQVFLNYPFSQAFDDANYDDIRWLVRRLATLTEADFREIVGLGRFPRPEFEELVYAKLIYRVKNLLEVFNLKELDHYSKPNLKVNSADGSVKNGKVMVQCVSSSPHRYSHGDRPAPFESADLGRIISLIAKNSVVRSIVNEVNKKLQLVDVPDVLRDHQKDVIKEAIEHIQKHPDLPLYKKRELFGGPLAGVNIKADRTLAYGPYFGSQSNLQVVDSFGWGMSVGSFLGIDGFTQVLPNNISNISPAREYAHVRPIQSVLEGSKLPWKNLLVPRYMNSLWKILENEKAEIADGEGKIEVNAIDQFLNELRPGESFQITDSVNFGTSFGLASSVDSLMGIDRLNFANSITVGLGISRIFTSQTQIYKTKEGLRILVRKQKADVLDVPIDINYFINLARLQATSNRSNLETQVYVINLNTDLFPNLNLDEVKEPLRKSLWALLKENNDGPLAFFFRRNAQFIVEHELDTKTSSAKLAWLRQRTVGEGHLVKVHFPENLIKENQEMLSTREIFTYKKAKLFGIDWTAFLTDTIDGFLSYKNSKFSMSRSQDPNPANSLYGNAFWRIIKTETDVSNVTEDRRYPTVSVLQRIWGGWQIGKDSFLDLLEDVINQVESTKLVPYRLLEPEAFELVKEIDFFRLVMNLSLVESGVEKIRDLILQPETVAQKSERPKFFLSRFYQKLSIGIGKKPKANDQEMFGELMAILGSGDKKIGYEQYLKQCKSEHAHHNNPIPLTGAWINGSNYECLSAWVNELLYLARRYPKSKEGQAKWATEVLYVLDQQIPIPYLLKYLGQDNYFFQIQLSGFRTSDEDGDLEFFSNSLGSPSKDFRFSNGLLNYLANQTGIPILELDRTQGGVQ